MTGPNEVIMKIPADMQVGTIHKTNNYGKLKITEYVSATKVGLIFLDTRFKTYAQAGDIRRSRVKDFLKPILFGVGFFGDGKFSAREDGRLTVRYNTWADMIQRCYDEKYHVKKPTYKNCTVCKEWHNYQLFSEWFEDNHIQGYQLDKDIKVDGNKIYSPETCMFVTGSDNAIKAFAKNYKFISPEGQVIKIYNLAGYCRDKDLHSSGLGKVHSGAWLSYKGWTKA